VYGIRGALADSPRGCRVKDNSTSQMQSNRRLPAPAPAG